MDNINTSVLTTHFSGTDTSRSAQTATVPVTSTPIVNTSQQPAATSSDKSKQLQPDQLALSEEARTKSAEAEANTEEKDVGKTSIDASSLRGAMSPAEAAAAEKAKESDLDTQIRELSMEILELSVKVQMLQDKEDKASIKERQSLEVDLAMKKGKLEALLEQKLQQAGAVQ
jgi:hypothetical protein